MARRQTDLVVTSWISASSSTCSPDIVLPTATGMKRRYEYLLEVSVYSSVARRRRSAWESKSDRGNLRQRHCEEILRSLCRPPVKATGRRELPIQHDSASERAAADERLEKGECDLIPWENRAAHHDRRARLPGDLRTLFTSTAR